MPVVLPGETAGELRSPRVVAGSGAKQITLTPAICGAQPLPLPHPGETREITTTGARCAQARL